MLVKQVTNVSNCLYYTKSELRPLFDLTTSEIYPLLVTWPCYMWSLPLNHKNNIQITLTLPLCWKAASVKELSLRLATLE